MVENAVWNKLTELLLDEETLVEKIQADREEAEEAHKIIEQTLTASEMQIEKDRVRLDRFLDLYADGGIDKATYLVKKSKIEKGMHKKRNDTAELRARLAEVPILDADREAEFRQLQQEIAARIDGGTFEGKSKLLQILRVECVYHDDTGQVVTTGVLGTHTLDLLNKNPSTTAGNR